LNIQTINDEIITL